MSKKMSLALACGCVLLLAGPAPAQTTQTKLTLDKLPAAVQEAVKAQGPGATVRGLAKEMKGGVTVYEAELTVNGRSRDILFDPQGKIVSMEEQTSLGEIPAGARAAISKAVGAGKLVLVEKVTEGEATFYEGHVSSGGRTSEVKVDAEGRSVE